MGDPDLARFQAALMALLYRKDITQAERMRILREDEAFAPYASYVNELESPLVELGVNIIQWWARPSGE